MKSLATDFAIMPFGSQIGFWATFFNILAFNFQICEDKTIFIKTNGFKSVIYDNVLEFVTGGVELLKAVLHGYAGGLIFMK